MSKIPPPRRPSPVKKVLRGLLSICLAVAFLGATAEAQRAPRVVAVGDIHGEYNGLVRILKEAGLIDGSLAWIGNDAVLVQTGDFLGRGAKVRPVMDLLMRLEQEAPRKGGRVWVLLGNHEMMNLMGEMRYVADEAFQTFTDQDSESQRREVFRDYLRFLGSPPNSTPELASQQEAAWMQAHPPGYLEYRSALGPQGKYGRWLRERPAAVKVGETLFLHAGIQPDLSFSLDQINRLIRDEIRSFDRHTKEMAQQGLIHPSFELDQIVAAARSALEDPPPGSREKDPPGGRKLSRRRALAKEFLNFGSWLSVHPDGPLWFRGYAQWSEEEGQQYLPGLLDRFRIKHLVVAHTPQLPGKIHARFTERVILIDTGMLASFYQGGIPSALEIQEGRFTAIYPGQRVLLFEE